MTAAHRIMLRAHGGPEVLEVEEFTPAPPGPGEIRLQQQAVGLNFIDIYHRTGTYPVELPSGIGSEAAGIIDAIGPGVTGFAPGDRVAYAGGPLGSYASSRVIPADIAVPLPGLIDTQTAAAALLKGMTAEFLVERCARVQPGQTVLVHAAAGGVGQILVQWLTAVGARVLAHAGNAEKAAAVTALGICETSSAPIDDVADWVREKTDGRGADVVFDGIGAASWASSLASVAPRGLIVSYGNASGAVPPVSLLDLTRAGSVFVTRPTLATYCSTSAERQASAARLFEMIGSGAIRVAIGQRFPLLEAAQAHQALASRATAGSTILIPQG